MKWLLVVIFLQSPGVTVELHHSAESPEHCITLAQDYAGDVRELGGEVTFVECSPEGEG